MNINRLLHTYVSDEGMLTGTPCQAPAFIPDIFWDYHFWRFYDTYPFFHDYSYDEYGDSGDDREYDERDGFKMMRNK